MSATRIQPKRLLQTNRFPAPSARAGPVPSSRGAARRSVTPLLSVASVMNWPSAQLAGGGRTSASASCASTSGNAALTASIRTQVGDGSNSGTDFVSIRRWLFPDFLACRGALGRCVRLTCKRSIRCHPLSTLEQHREVGELTFTTRADACYPENPKTRSTAPDPAGLPQKAHRDASFDSSSRNGRAGNFPVRRNLEHRYESVWYPLNRRARRWEMKPEVPVAIT